MGVHTYCLYAHAYIHWRSVRSWASQCLPVFSRRLELGKTARLTDGPAHFASHTESFPLSLLALLSRSLFQVMVNISVHICMYVHMYKTMCAYGVSYYLCTAFSLIGFSIILRPFVSFLLLRIFLWEIMAINSIIYCLPAVLKSKYLYTSIGNR